MVKTISTPRKINAILLIKISLNQPETGTHVWIYTGNKSAKFRGNILSVSENIAISFGGGLLF